MLDAMAQVIGRPTAFFRRLQAEEKLAGRAIWVVLLVAILAAVVGYFSALPSAEAFRGSPLSSISLVSAPLFAFAITFVGWLIYGLIVRMTAGLGAKPWAVVGYSMAPQLILFTLLIVIAALFPVEVASSSLDFSDPEAFQAGAQQVQLEVQRSVFGRSSQIINYAALLWWLALVFIGVRTGTDRSKAVLSVALLGLLSLGIVLLPFLLAPVGG